jgi:hypothetical protein
MTRLVLAVVAWHLLRRLIAPAIVIALAMLLLHSGTSVRHPGRNAVGVVERIVRAIEPDLRHALTKAFRR